MTLFDIEQLLGRKPKLAEERIFMLYKNNKNCTFVKDRFGNLKVEFKKE